MRCKVTAAAIYLGAILFSFPVHAESLSPPPPQTATENQTTPAQPDEKAAGVDASDSDFDKVNLKYIKSYAVDTGKIMASPLRWETKDWLKVGLVLGGTSSLFLIDQKVNNFAQKHQNPVASKVADVGNFIGNPPYMYPSLGAFYLYGYLADDSKARRASLLAIESLTISGVITSGIKMLARRHRPNTGHLSSKWDGPSFTSNNVSFSSGHTSSAFAVATVFAEEYKDNAYVPPIAYGLATLTGLSRIYSNEHWSSDAFFGAAVGYLVSKAVLGYHKKDKKKSDRLTVTPAVGNKMTGVTVNYAF